MQSGGLFTCGVREGGGELHCWGGVDRDGERLGDVPSGRFLDVSAGSQHACGVRDDGAVVCWGADHAGDTAVPEGLRLF